VRIIGRGRQSVVYLGHPASAHRSSPAHDRDSFSGERIVAVKVFDDRAAARMSNEIELLSAATSDHIVTLRDFAWLPAGRGVLVEKWVPGPSVTEWLDRQRQITPGQATTLAVSIVRAEAALQEAGWASRGGVSPSRFRLDANGRPVLVGLGGSARLAEGSQTGTDLSRGVSALIQTLACRLPPAVRGGWKAALLDDWSRITSAPASPHQALAAIEDRLFACATPQPVLPEAGATPMAPASHRASLVSMAPVMPDELLDGADDSDAEGLADRIRRLGDDARHILVSRRRPLIIAAVVGGALLALALTLLPLGPASHTSAASGNTPGRGAISTSQGETSKGPTGRSAPGSAVPNATSESATRGQETTAVKPTGLTGHASGPVDPAEAAIALLSAREKCMESASTACIELIDEPGSPQARSDATSTMAATEYAPADLAGMHATLVQRTGAAALVALKPAATAKTEPFSVLLIQTKYGWAIREVFE
jgi:hypothetical protein